MLLEFHDFVETDIVAHFLHEGTYANLDEGVVAVDLLLLHFFVLGEDFAFYGVETCYGVEP